MEITTTTVPPTTTTTTMGNPRKVLPRSLQFQRMERIVKAMQHPTAGVPVRNQKLFLTTVPNAFTGTDIAEWIIQKLNVKDSGKSKSIFVRKSNRRISIDLFSGSIASCVLVVLLWLLFSCYDQWSCTN